MGKEGEDLATKYLISRGFKILERNFRTPFGEIDIIAVKDGKLHFIEVKTRSSENFGRGAEAVDKRKLSHIVSSINFYLKGRNFDYEIGILDILKVGNDFEINYIRDIF
ncbi:YraN family protein [Caldisericum exile]|uniref:YraN family protein n=1 Tax=Caldisericum exile TaxID=693075 RepID=UPI00155ABA8A|nr:YraN family protein [Caldisericum exile]